MNHTTKRVSEQNFLHSLCFGNSRTINNTTSTHVSSHTTWKNMYTLLGTSVLKPSPLPRKFSNFLLTW